MFFWNDRHETPLTEAVIHQDLQTVKKLSRHVDHRLAKNYLGFNGVEIARYLDRKECLKILEPQKKRQFHVLFQGESKVRTIKKAELESYFHFTYQSHLKLADYDIFKKVLKDYPYKDFNTFSEMDVQEILKHRSIEEIAKQKTKTAEILAIHSFLYQQKVNEGFFADVTIKWIDDVLGYGVFANQNLKIGDYIGEYAGALKLCYQFPLQVSFNVNEYCFAYPKKLFARRYFAIDAKTSGNEMRFVNHSSYEPLLVSKLLVDRRLTHVIFVAGADIPKGTQITFDYGEDYWRHREPPLDILIAV